MLVPVVYNEFGDLWAVMCNFLSFCYNHFNDLYYVTASQDGVYTKQFSLLFSTLNLCCQWIICVRAHKLFCFLLFLFISRFSFSIHTFFIIFIFISGLRKFSINGLFSMCAIYIIFSPVPKECLYTSVCLWVCVSEWVNEFVVYKRSLYNMVEDIWGEKKQQYSKEGLYELLLMLPLLLLLSRFDTLNFHPSKNFSSPRTISLPPF